MRFAVELEQEWDGCSIAEVLELPGVLAYGSTPEEARAKRVRCRKQLSFARRARAWGRWAGTKHPLECESTRSTISSSRYVISTPRQRSTRASALGDVDVARQLAATIDTAELFLYPGDRHLFADGSLAEYDESAAALLLRRVLEFLEELS